jgi:dUTP pyrophosphatase
MFDPKIVEEVLLQSGINPVMCANIIKTIKLKHKTPCASGPHHMQIDPSMLTANNTANCETTAPPEFGTDGMPIILEIVNPNKPFKAPTYGSQHAAARDIYAAESIAILPGATVMVSTNFRMQVPVGWKAEIYPRSGMAAKHSIIIPNSPGKIDADYRGEVMVLLHNLGVETFQVNVGDRIAQMEINPYLTWQPMVGKVDMTVRGEGGFGHTGK